MNYTVHISALDDLLCPAAVRSNLIHFVTMGTLNHTSRGILIAPTSQNSEQEHKQCSAQPLLFLLIKAPEKELYVFENSCV